MKPNRLLSSKSSFLSCVIIAVWLSVNTTVPAALIPVNDNTSAPYLGVFGGPLYSDGTIHDEYFASWLNRTGIWAVGFNGNYNTWTGIEGSDYIVKAAKIWVQNHPGSKYVLSVGMLPGAGATPLAGHTLAKGANGDYDAHFITLATRLKNHGPVNDTIIRLGWEFNGTWYPWCIKNNESEGRKPEYFKAYFARIVTTMRSVPGCENLKFCWNGTTVWNSYQVREAYPRDIPESTVFPVHPAYPGNNYVDYVGVDLYDTSDNYYPSTTQAARDAAWAEQASTYFNHIASWTAVAANPAYGNGKPFCFPEWGLSSNSGNGGGDNPEFIRHMFEFIQDPVNNVAWHCYFDVPASSNHRISSMPGGTPTLHPIAAAKYKQLFGLPLPNSNNIGTVGVPGTCDGSTVSGAGAGYLATGTADNFFFSSREAAVNDMFLVEINSMDSGTAAQSGVMLRQGTAAGDKYAALFLRNGQCVFQSRTAAGAAVQNNAASVAMPTPAAPVWLKLVRQGNNVTGYYSTDGGLNWIHGGGQAISLSGTAYVGLAVSSGNTTALNATSHDNMENPDILTGLETSIANKIIKDNADTSGIAKTGSWGTGTTRSGKYLADYNSSGTSLPAKTITFTPVLPGTGLYDVYLRWPDYVDNANDLASDVPITVTSTAGPDPLLANQQLGKSLWNHVGTYSMAPGAGSLQLSSSTTGTGSYTLADAVMFVPLPEALVANPSFEVDASGSQAITGWSESGTNPEASAVKSTVAAHTGTRYLGHYATTAYDAFTYQAKTGLANGSYTLKAWVQRAGAQTTARMEASGFGGSTLTANIPVASAWTQITISGINVTNGTCTFGFRSVGPSGSSIKVDDVEFYKQ